MRTPARVVVFGGTGFLGRALIPHLAALGYRIVVPTRDPAKALPLKTAGPVGQVVPIPLSLRNEAAVARVLVRADVVFNLIGILTEHGASTFEALHVQTAARLARLAREAGALRFVHVSALGVGAHSSSRYARTKAAGEEAVRTFLPSCTVFRPGLMLGHGDRFVGQWTTMARWSPVLPLIGGGVTLLQPVDVDDVATALTLTLTTPAMEGKTYALGGPSVYSLRHLTERIVQGTGRRHYLVPVPWRVALGLGRIFELFPTPPWTRDVVRLLETDNVVRCDLPTFADLGLKPRAIETLLPSLLDGPGQRPEGLANLR